MAGVAGFEPAHAGIKTRCLTAWRHPICLTTETVMSVHSAATFFALQPAADKKAFVPSLPLALAAQCLFPGDDFRARYCPDRIEQCQTSLCHYRPRMADRNIKG